MKNILLIEDDMALSNGIRLGLQSSDYHIIQCTNLKETKEVDIAEISLILLDINLPDGNGLEYLQKLRENRTIPII